MADMNFYIMKREDANREDDPGVEPMVEPMVEPKVEPELVEPANCGQASSGGAQQYHADNGQSAGIGAALRNSFAGMMAFDSPLAFVNRCAECLDVLVPNLRNQASLLLHEKVKYNMPLAMQSPGMGQTALSDNLIAILNRPREPDAAAETAVADQLRGAWCWGGSPATYVDQALRDHRPENLVVRTLLAAFPHPDLEKTILRLKSATPLVIETKSLVTPRFDLDFEEAVAYAIFCKAHGSEPITVAPKLPFWLWTL
jgi:hypothetical protein